MSDAVAIVGGGPAGMSCALWLIRLGYSPVILEQGQRLGGAQNLSPFHNAWYLGLPSSTGMQIAEQFEAHVRAKDIKLVRGTQVLTVVRDGADFRIITDQGLLMAGAVVVATGQRLRGMEDLVALAGCEDLAADPRVSWSPGDTPGLQGEVDDKVVVVVGGGDNGLVTATNLSATAAHVHLLVRSGMRGFAINRELVADLVEAGHVTLHARVRLSGFEVGQQLTVGFADADGQQRIACDVLCLQFGFTANVNPFPGLTLTATGHIATDPFGRTSQPGIYACGDVSNPRDPCVATAVGQGAVVARSIEEDGQLVVAHR